MTTPAPNTICLWYDGDAEDAARFYAETFPDSAVTAVHRAPGDYPDGKEGDVLTVQFTVLGIPCLTLRENTERPITVTHGTNRIVGTRAEDIVKGFEEALESNAQPRVPELWDGHAADRIAGVFVQFLS